MPEIDTAQRMPDASPQQRIATQSLDVKICDVPILIEGLSPELHGRLEDLLLPFVVEPEVLSPALRIEIRQKPDSPWWTVTHGDRLEQQFFDVDTLLRHVEWLAISRALDATRRVAIFHGAALARDGRVILLLAKSGAGKTTLTMGLLGRGWEPLADDVAVVDRETLEVAHFPRCFHVDEGTRALLGDSPALVSAGGLDGYARPTRWSSKGPRPHAIVVMERCATCPSSRSPLLQAEAVGALVTSVISNRVPKAEVVRVAVRLAAGAHACVRLRNGHLDGALNLIEQAASS